MKKIKGLPKTYWSKWKWKLRVSTLKSPSTHRLVLLILQRSLCSLVVLYDSSSHPFSFCNEQLNIYLNQHFHLRWFLKSWGMADCMCFRAAKAYVWVISKGQNRNGELSVNILKTMEKSTLSTRCEHLNVHMHACVYVGGHGVCMCLCTCMVYMRKCICVDTCLHSHVESGTSTQVLRKFWSTAPGEIRSHPCRGSPGFWVSAPVGMQKSWPGFPFLVFPSHSYPAKCFEGSALGILWAMQTLGICKCR